MERRVRCRADTTHPAASSPRRTPRRDRSVTTASAGKSAAVQMAAERDRLAEMVARLQREIAALVNAERERRVSDDAAVLRERLTSLQESGARERADLTAAVEQLTAAACESDAAARAAEAEAAIHRARADAIQRELQEARAAAASGAAADSGAAAEAAAAAREQLLQEQLRAGEEREEGLRAELLEAAAREDGLKLSLQRSDDECAALRAQLAAALRQARLQTSRRPSPPRAAPKHRSPAAARPSSPPAKTARPTSPVSALREMDAELVDLGVVSAAASDGTWGRRSRNGAPSAGERLRRLQRAADVVGAALPGGSARRVSASTV